MTRQPKSDDAATFRSVRARESLDRLEKVQKIARHMAEGTWDATLVLDLAQEWDLSVRRVQELAVHAGDVVASALSGTLEQLRTIYLSRARRIGNEALAAAEYNAAVRALETEISLRPGLIEKQSGSVQNTAVQVVIAPADAKRLEAELECAQLPPPKPEK